MTNANLTSTDLSFATGCSKVTPTGTLINPLVTPPTGTLINGLGCTN